jgi:hypothetical protein
MTKQTFIIVDKMCKAEKSAERFATNYWAGFSTEQNHDPIKMASFYKESGHK